MKGIILLAHGSRDPRWVEPFEKLRAAVERRQPKCATVLAYLDHTTPDFTTAVDDLVARGATVINIVPLFLGAGGHVRVDVPRLVDQARVKHAAVKFDLKAFVGDSSAVLEAIADYAVSDSKSN